MSTGKLVREAHDEPGFQNSRSRIIDDRDRKRFEQKASLSAADFDASHRASYTLDLPLAKLEPGPYLLTVDTRADKARTTRYVRFTVK
jgi:hypothetical protein